MAKKKPIIFALLLTLILLSGCAENKAEDTTEIIPSDEEIVEIMEESEPDIDVIIESESDNTEISEETVKADNSGIRIICWGDSMTEGTGGDGVTYPDELAKLSGATVINYGVYNDFASTIAARCGGSPQHVEDMGTIPAECVPVRVNIVGDDGHWEMICNFGDAGLNPCIVAGVEGNFSIDGDTGERFFTRLTPGEAVEVPDGTPVTTYAMRDKKDDDILVIWSGNSDHVGPEGMSEIIARQQSMLDYCGCSRYVIIGFQDKKGIPELEADNDIFEEQWGEHFLNTYDYLMAHGLEEAGITPTPQDLEDLNAGDIPTSLRSDEVHGTADMYKIIGRLVYEKLIELNYLEQ